MIITAMARTYNEERNLERFVKAYHDWVDFIVIHDDQSKNKDYLFDVVSKYPKTRLSFYSDRRMVGRTVSMAYHDTQLNEMIGIAETLGSNWIIMDDCDSIPNKSLRENGKTIIESCDKDFIYILKIHFYKNRGVFLNLSKPAGKFEACLWAWKAGKGFRFLDRGRQHQGFEIPKEERILRLDVPYCALHYPWPNDDEISIKRTRYTEIFGQEYTDFDPIRFGGPLSEPPEWAVE